MHTLNVICDVPPTRVVTLKLPETVSPGQHELLVVIDTLDATPRFQDLSPAAQAQHLTALQARWRERLSQVGRAQDVADVHRGELGDLRATLRLCLTHRESQPV